MEFATVVVIYNQFCGDSPTCQALRQGNPDIRVLIFDNSTKDMGNREYCLRQGWTYLGGTGNQGISKAYNACIDLLKTQGFGGTVCLFDDDTAVAPAYFEELRKARTAGAGRILVPLIYAGERLLSPSLIRRNHSGRTFQTDREALAYRGGELSAINSCMALDMALFRDYRYDEHIFLDGIDHAFLMDMKRRGETITVFPYRCDHDFSGASKSSKQAALTRFRIYAKDYRYILRRNLWAYMALVGKRALRLTAQHPSFVFASVFMRNLFSKP